MQIRCTITSYTPPTVDWSTTTDIKLKPRNLPNVKYVSTVRLGAITIAHAGSYTCTVTNSGGTVSATTSVSVIGKLTFGLLNSNLIKFITFVVLAPTVSIGVQLHIVTSYIMCNVTSLTTPTITWSTTSTYGIVSVMDSGIIDSTYYSVAAVNPTRIDETGVYTCNATNYGGTNTQSVTVDRYSKHMSIIRIIYA